MFSTTMDVDPFHSDGLSILSFGDDTSSIMGLGELVSSPPCEINFEQSETKTSPPEVQQDIRSVPISDDESISGASLFSDTSLQFLCDESHHDPSMEEMVVKLNRSMMRSARSRAMVSKTVFPDLRKQSLERKNKKQMVSSFTSFRRKSSLVRKAQRSNATKHTTYSNSNGVDKSSLLHFLRATKKW